MDALLLCELHAHTTWSDGVLTLTELVDLYGEHGFDVLCITDHSVRLDDPMPSAVDSWTWPAYITEIRAEAERAYEEYELVDDLRAVTIAAHPYARGDVTPMRPTRRIASEPEIFRPLLHRYEVFNRDEVFGWVAEAGLAPIASGDVHRAAHIASWKTLLPCEKDAEAVVDYLRSRGRVCLMPYAIDRRDALPAAA
jgi:PHP domain